MLLKFIYLILTLPIFLFSILIFVCCKGIRADYQEVRARISKYKISTERAQLISVLISGEDHRYLYHYGIDQLAIVRATYRLIRLHKIEGASTIEQQFVRTCIGRYEISIARKLREIILSVLISLKNNKADIANSYLQCAYFGHKTYGLEDAKVRLERLLHKAPVHSAELIALLKHPFPLRNNNLWLTKFTTRARWIRKKTISF